MIGIAGFGSSIAQALLPLLPPGEEAVRFTHDRLPWNCTRYLFCAGHLVGEQIGLMDDEQSRQTWEVNFREVAAACDRILDSDPEARICVVGSESGIAGSFDMAYAGAKAALHLYVQTRRLAPDQQLVAVAPGIIYDSGMTERRADFDQLAARTNMHPKGRFLTALEVAKVVHFLLYQDQGYLTGTVIRLNGGPPCR